MGLTFADRIGGIFAVSYTDYVCIQTPVTMRLYTETHILVVEDQPDLLSNLCAMLRDEGYFVDGAGDGQLGLEYALERVYDVIVLDMMLPGIDGSTVIKKLRKKRNTPVIFLTAIDSIDTKMACFDSGADDYLTKPFHIRELKARVANLLKSQRERKPNLLNIGNIQIDTVKRQVMVDSEPAGITHREYNIAEFLALHRGRAVSRHALHELCLDESDDAASNLLDVYISNLRKKLGKDFIQTLRGFGYCIP